MRFVALALVAAILFGGSPSFAAVPQIDPAKVCDAVARLHGPFDQDVYDRCLTREQAAYEALKALWPIVSAEVRRRCQGQDDSYDHLAGCLKHQAASILNGLKF